MSKFPLLRAPSLVLSKIVELATPREIVNLSLCSKRCHRLLIIHRAPKPTDWFLTMTSGNHSAAVAYYPATCDYVFLFNVKNFSELKSDDPQILSINKHRVPTIYKNECLVTYWEDEILGMKTVLDHVSGLFRIDILYLMLARKCYWALDWINNRQKATLKKVSVNANGDEWTVEEFTHMLRTLRPTDTMKFHAIAPPNFRFDGTFPVCDEIYLSGTWIKMHHVIAMDAIEIVVWKSALTNWDVNAFLKHWLGGGSPRLEYINLELAEDVNGFEILGNGLEAHARNVFEVRQYKRGNHGIQYLFQGGIGIQREDGVAATINCYGRELFMAVWPIAEK